MVDGNDLLGRTGRPWAKWENVGDIVVGKVIETPGQRQSRDYESGELASWPDGNPKLEVVVAIQTDARDPEIDFDDGERIVVLPTGSNKFRAVQQAIRKAGSKGLHPGDILSIRYSGDGERPPGKKGGFPPKLFDAAIEKAPKGAADNALDALSALGAKPAQGEVPF